MYPIICLPNQDVTICIMCVPLDPVTSVAQKITENTIPEIEGIVVR